MVDHRLRVRGWSGYPLACFDFFWFSFLSILLLKWFNLGNSFKMNGMYHWNCMEPQSLLSSYLFLETTKNVKSTQNLVWFSNAFSNAYYWPIHKNSFLQELRPCLASNTKNFNFIFTFSKNNQYQNILIFFTFYITSIIFYYYSNKKNPLQYKTFFTFLYKFFLLYNASITFY